MKKIIILSLLFSTVFLLFSCKGEDCCMSKDLIRTNLVLSLVDKHQNDLLYPAYEHAYKAENIHLYYVNDHIPTKVYNPNSDYPKGFFIFTKNQNEFGIQISLNNQKTNNKSRTIINWSQTIIDTIDVEFNTSNEIQKLWINNKESWKRTNSNENIIYLTLIKEK
ncbi:hypothetical protein LZQ00_13135 [Sphingobacterium sp. SRCM116780]|uniref:hypothetical protein n=1 Tax=Sphingobacterium sp. SRCM116780 TaxID=2907623 RepID=UPI001F29EFB2|nr:hypothetical protein [Sphingobacterium sp. SRCM116780]UIR55211.1 hypothetical protein LZQ00_13135 [Sphingobacterium sp. SRCM116780]